MASSSSFPPRDQGISSGQPLGGAPQLGGSKQPPVYSRISQSIGLPPKFSTPAQNFTPAQKVKTEELHKAILAAITEDDVGKLEMAVNRASSGTNPEITKGQAEILRRTLNLRLTIVTPRQTVTEKPSSTSPQTTEKQAQAPEGYLLKESDFTPIDTEEEMFEGDFSQLTGQTTPKTPPQKTSTEETSSASAQTTPGWVLARPKGAQGPAQAQAKVPEKDTQASPRTQGPAVSSTSTGQVAPMETPEILPDEPPTSPSAVLSSTVSSAGDMGRAKTDGKFFSRLKNIGKKVEDVGKKAIDVGKGILKGKDKGKEKEKTQGPSSTAGTASTLQREIKESREKTLKELNEALGKAYQTIDESKETPDIKASRKAYLEKIVADIHQLASIPSEEIQSGSIYEQMKGSILTNIKQHSEGNVSGLTLFEKRAEELKTFIDRDADTHI